MSPTQPPTRLLAVPNFSEGRNAASIEAIRHVLVDREDDMDREDGIALLDVHSDADHHRSVYTLAGSPAGVVDALVQSAREAVARIDVMSGEHQRDGRRRGEHPHVGALDVAPIVYYEKSARGAAIVAALVLADRLGEELDLPVFLYGELAGGRTRAELRAGGVAGLAQRMVAGQIRPDFGPARMHPSAGATLIAAREPLVAFNLRLAPPATVQDARRIAASIREGGPEGLPGVRAIGVQLAGEIAQVSTNVEDPLEVPLVRVIEQVRGHAEVLDGELVGLAPRAALAQMPSDLELPGFDPRRHVIENVLGYVELGSSEADCTDKESSRHFGDQALRS
jgi:glutamate formiminotransferase / 5-formyltetrahydrofolate cyclo-ligase